MKRALILLLCVSSAIAAGPIDEIRSRSGLTGLDLEKLKRGEIISARGPLGGFPRGIHVEACYYVRAPVQTVREKLLHWDTSKKPELQVSVLREYTWPTTPHVFDDFALNSNNSKDKWLIDRTRQVLTTGQPGDLFITVAEAKSAKLPANVPADQVDVRVNEFWKRILASRDKALFSGGLLALPEFMAGKTWIFVHREFNELMQMPPNITVHFLPLTNAKPFVEDGNTPDEIVPYWQASLVQGHTSLHAGFLAAQKRPGSWLVADCTYFTSDTYFMSVTLFELFPVENGTLVWQIDFVSAPFKPYLGGTDRFFAGKEMIKGTAKTIELFRRHAER